MQRPRRKTVTLDDIVITEELPLRSPRSPNWQAEAQAMHTLARQMVDQPEIMLQTLVDIALDLCQAETAGISELTTTPDGSEVFRPNVLAGALAQYVGGTTPRKESPCGVCLDRGTPVLFSHPERYFTYFQAANTPIVEGLVLPLIADDRALGTIWIMSHDENRHFDFEDVRVMTSLADFTAAALLLNQRQTGELLAANAALETEIAERKLSEARSRALISNLPGGAAFVVDRNLRYLLAEGEALAIAGFKREDFVGQTIFEVLPPELAANYEPLYRKALAGEPFEHEHYAHDRTYISRGTPLRAENGEIYAVLAVSYDISDRKLAEAALSKSEERFRLFVTASSDIVYRMSADWREMRRLEGKNFIVNTENPSQTWIETYIPQEEQLRVWAAIQNAIRTKSTFELEHRVIQQDGAIGWTFSRAIPKLNEQGDIVEWFGSASDVTLRKQAEAALRESEARLAVELADAKQLQFISSQLVHEENIDALYEQILSAAIALMRSEMGSMQMLHPDCNELQLLAWKGFDPASAAFWERVRVDSESTCGVALRTGERAIVPDVEKSEFMAGSGDLDSYRLSGVRAVQTTLLISRSGQVVGMISTHWQSPHQPSERELGLLDVLARQAADLIEQRQAEAAQIEAQESFQIAVEAAEMGIWDLDLTKDSSGRRSLRHDRVFGYDDSQPEWGQEIARRHIVEEDLEIFDGAFARALETGELKFEVRLRWSDGSIHWMACNGRFYFDANGKPVRGAGVNFDITDRKHAEAQLRRAAQMDAFRVKLSDALRSLSDPAEIKYQAACVLGEHLGSDRAYYVEIDEARSEFVVARDWHQPGAPSHARRYPLSGWPMPWLVDGQPWVVRNVDVDPAMPDDRRESYRGNDIGALIVVPLIKNGRLVATLATNQHNPRDWTADEITVVQETAERTWAAVERAYAEAALHESEQKYRTLFDSIDEGLAIVEMIYDDQGEIVDIIFRQVNRAYERHGGVYNVVGRSIFDVIPGVENYWLDLYERVARTGEAVREENYQQDVDRWFDVYFSRVDDNGRFVAIIFSDISDRKRAEQTLRESEARQAFLLQMSDALRAEPDANSVANRAVRMLALHLHLDRVWLSEVFEQQGIATIGSEYHRSDLPPMSGVYRLSDYPETMRRIATQPMVIHDVASDPDFSDSEKALLAQLHLRALLVVALRKGQHQVIWALVFAMSTPRHWNESERVLLEEVGEYVWAAIERARAEAALRESEEKYRSLFESINDAFALLEVLYDDDNQPVDCRFLEVSPSFEVQTGLPQAQGKTLRELIPSVESGWFDHYHQALVTNALVHFEIYQSYLKIWFEVDVLPYGNPQDRQVTIVFQNINDRKQAEAERLQLIREQAAREQERQRAENLAELDRAKTLFFSNVSHEFRTPLTLLLAPLSDALSDSVDPLSPSQRERLELAHRSANRLLKLVNTLLDFSRIEAGRMEAVYEPTDLALFTTELASVFRSAIERAGLRLIVDCPALPEPVYVDREMWEKIVLNLLSNAFKFTLEGEITVRLHPTDSECVMLQIGDTGTGIAPEELPHLFERFYQVRGAASRTHEGSGIGLALVQELIKMHGGTVEVSSTIEQGTCFTITIPLGTAHLPSDRLRRVVGDHTTTPRMASTALGAAPYVEEVERWLPKKNLRLAHGNFRLEETSQNNSKSKIQNPKSKILLVDDNADMRNYLKRILSEYVQVEAVSDGAAALAAIGQTLPDLVLSDVMMPIVDGLELVKALRADARTREVPIVLLSARAGEESVIEGLVAGADDYLIKPFSATSLVTRVLAHLGMAQLRSNALHQEKTNSRIKDKFLAEVAHELNTPLVAILGWTRLLRSNPSNQSMLSKSLETIERNATVQAKLIEDLLDISRITAGKISLNQEPVELQQAIEGAIASVSQSLKTKDISLECLLDPLPRIVQGDPNRLQQIFLNLLTNAIKFTPNGGRIEVSLEASETQAQIILTDTGCGIPASELPYIFDTFRQASASNKGLGLGLAIARHLVELHNGTIDAASSGVGLGATFTVRLPILQ